MVENKKPIRSKNFEVLNARTRRPVMNFLKEHYGFTGKLDYALILTVKSKLYAVSRTVFDMPVEQLKVNSFGVYFGEWKDDQLRLSIEGSQMIGKECSKNIIELTGDEVQLWMQGKPVPRTPVMNGQGAVLIVSGKDYLGGGKIGEDTLHNYVPKNRRIRFALEV